MPRRTLLLLALLLSLLSKPAFAVLYSVEPQTGTDVTGCGTGANPDCRTFSFLQSDVSLGAGDTVCLRNDSGNAIFREHIVLTSGDSGVSGNEFTLDYQCAGQANRAVHQQPSGGSTDSALLRINGASYIIVEDAWITQHDGAGKRGIRVHGNSHHIWIYRPKVFETGANGSASSIGLDVGSWTQDGGHNIFIEGTPVVGDMTARANKDNYDCQIHDNFWNEFSFGGNTQTGSTRSHIKWCALWGARGSTESDVIQGKINGDNWTISDNLVMGGREDTIDLGYGSGSFECVLPENANTGGKNNIIERNMIIERPEINGAGPSTEFGALITVNGCQEDTIIRNNVLYGSRMGLRFYNSPIDIKVLNNTVYTEQEAVRVWQAVDGMQIENNIFAACIDGTCDNNNNRVFHIDRHTINCAQADGRSTWKNNVVFAGGDEVRIAQMDRTGGSWRTGFCGSEELSPNTTNYDIADKATAEAADWLGPGNQADLSWGVKADFQDISNFNFTLLEADTAARNLANVLPEVTVDVLGNARDGTPDIGAVEWGSDPPVEPPPTSSDLVVASVMVGGKGSTGNQTITIPALGGKTPKAARIVATYDDTANDTALAFAHHSIGYVCNGIQRTTYGGSSDGVTGGDTLRGDVFDSVVAVFGGDASGPSPVTKAQFVSFGADEMVINWTAVEGGLDPQLMVTLFAGDTVEDCNVGTYKLGALDEAIDINTIGFQPSMTFTSSAARLSTTGGSQASDIRNGWGVSSFDGTTLTEASIGYSDGNGDNPSAVNVGIYDTAFSRLLFEAGGSGPYVNVNSSAYDSQGFTVALNDGIGTGRTGHYMALKLATGVYPHIEVVDTCTTSSKAYTGFGFEPQSALLYATALTTNNAHDNTSPGGVSWGFVNQDLTTGSVGVVSTDGVATTDTWSRAESKLHLMTEGGGTLIQATAASMDSDGLTLNCSTSNGTARKMIMVAFPVEEAPPVEPPSASRRIMSWSRRR